MTLDERLVDRVDRAANKLGKTRSAFTREALRDAMEMDQLSQRLGASPAERLAALEKERRHRRGYEARPVERGEFDDWAKEQVWPD